MPEAGSAPPGIGMRSDWEPDFAQNAAFHNEVAAEYDVHLRSSPYNDLARAAFRDLVARYAPSGSTLLDFGCGTGLDAQHYAQQGYRVLAYDNSPGMMAQLEVRCRPQIASGAVATCAAEYPRFLARFPEWPAPDTVVANFAVLNSIRDLSPLFETFARHLRPPGWVIVSILNPLHWAKVKTPGWWLDAWRSPAGPRLFSTRPYRTYLHFLPALLRSARSFHLVGRANAGAFVRYDAVAPSREPHSWWGHADSPKDRFARVLWQTPAFRLLGHFQFLVLRRDP
jgi:SAM-dependent methyltransferase